MNNIYAYACVYLCMYILKCNFSLSTVMKSVRENKWVEIVLTSDTSCFASVLCDLERQVEDTSCSASCSPGTHAEYLSRTGQIL